MSKYELHREIRPIDAVEMVDFINHLPIPVGGKFSKQSVINLVLSAPTLSDEDMLAYMRESEDKE